MELDNRYVPVSRQKSLETLVPQNMLDDTNYALQHLQTAVGGDVDAYVCRKLKMTPEELTASLAAEQVDGVALAIYNIEERHQGLIIGDQTGLGKGRQAASIIRYAIVNGYYPIFITAKMNLFSDLYRDLKAVGAAHYRPLLLNANSKMVDYAHRVKFTDSEDDLVLLSDYKTVYTADKDFQREVRNDANPGLLAKMAVTDYDYIALTYSQLNRGELSTRSLMLEKLTEKKKVIFVLDESHEASGHSNQGRAMAKLLEKSQGCVFLSATFAKRAENLFLYSSKTALGNSGIEGRNLESALERGGLPLQEMLSSQLVRYGQMIRREKDYSGLEVDYMVFDHSEERDVELYDNVVETIREIQQFHLQKARRAIRDFVDFLRTELKAQHVDKGLLVLLNKMAPCSEFSYVPGIMEALTLAIKVDNIAAETVRLVKEGNKVVVALSKTAGSIISRLLNPQGKPATVGDTVNASFTNVLLEALHRTLHVDGVSAEIRPYVEKYLDKSGCIMPPEDYEELYAKIAAKDFGLPVAPIDVILQELRSHGIRVAECTGRSHCIEYTDAEYNGILRARHREPVDWVYNEFQNNRIDVMITNSTGSTGASAHAISTPSVPEEEVKRRIMIIAQPELNINTEIQKRGRINRVGQMESLPPKYVYVSSVVPHERRTLMMLKRKLKSLDANTSSSQYQNDKMLECSDFCNKYGDETVSDWLDDNPGEDLLMSNPRGEQKLQMSNLAVRTTGRLAVLDCAEQERFYNEVIENYDNYIQMLIDDDEYDLETMVKDYQAKTESSGIFSKGDNSLPMGGDAILNAYTCKVHRKPYSYEGVVEHIRNKYPDFDPKRPETYNDWKVERSIVEKWYDSAMDEVWATAKNPDSRDRMIDKLREQKNEVLWALGYFNLGRYVKVEIEGKNVDGIVTGIKLGSNLTPGNVNIEFALAHYLRNRSYNCVRRIKNGVLQDCGFFRLKQIAVNSELSLTKSLMEMNKDRWKRQSSTMQSGTVTKHIITGNIIRSYADDLVNEHGRHIVFTLSNGETLHGVQVANNLSSKLSRMSYVPLKEALAEPKDHSYIDRIVGKGIDIGVWYNRSSRSYFRLHLSRTTIKTLEEAGLKAYTYDLYRYYNCRTVWIDELEKNRIMNFLVDYGCTAQMSSQQKCKPEDPTVDTEYAIWPMVS
ncbi:MAG: strawberry notch family protein [Muribaculaceae bacterium]|nr:strawberry notch family protein [Muribaculaceae bacterium]